MARLVLRLLLICSLLSAGYHAWLAWTSPIGGLFVARGEAEIRSRLETLLMREVTPEKVRQKLDALLAQTPHDWPAIDAVKHLAEAQGALPPDVAARVQAAYDADHGYFARSRQCLKCAWDPTLCTLDLTVLCQVGVALSPFGDAASIVLESAHYARGQPVDDINLLLSTIGLGADAIAPLTAGSALALSAGANLVRAAYRIGALSEPVVKAGRRVMQEAIDWDRLAKASPGTLLTHIRSSIRPAELRPAVEFVENADAIRKSTDLQDTMILLRKIDSPQEAGQMRHAAEALGDKTTGAVELVGKKRLFGTMRRLSADAVWLVGSLVSAMAALVGALWGILGSLAHRIGLRALRRLAR